MDNKDEILTNFFDFFGLFVYSVDVYEFYEWGVLGQAAYKQFAFVAEYVAALGFYWKIHFYLFFLLFSFLFLLSSATLSIVFGMSVLSITPWNSSAPHPMAYKGT